MTPFDSTPPTAEPYVSEILDAALDYQARGFSVIPLEPRGKKPLIDWKRLQTEPATPTDITQWWKECPNANVGILTGSGSGFVVLDIDGPEGDESLRQLGTLPQTPMSRTARGRHVLFACPAGVPIRNQVGFMPGLDIRGDRGYIVAPPSLHASGHRYAWENGCGLDLPFAEPPEWLTKVLSASEAPAGQSKGLAPITMGDRNNTLTRIAGALLREGTPPEGLADRLQRVNLERCQPPLDFSEVRVIALSISGREARKRHTSQAPTCLRLSDVATTSIEWLWPGYIAAGKITMIDGEPGVGKSTLAMDVAARLTTHGTMPDGTRGLTGGVVLLSAEEGMGDTVRPRFEALGGNPTRVCIPSLDGSLKLPDCVEWLEQAIADVTARLVVIDPVMSYLPGTLNSWSDQDVRAALDPLAQLAQRTGVAIVAIRHLNKKEGQSALNRGGGSTAFAAVARAAFLVGVDPSAQDRRVFAPVKFNLGRRPPSQAFRIGDAGGNATLVWEGLSLLTADDLVRPRPPGKLGEATQFVSETLSQGPMPTKELEERAHQAGIAPRTLARARKELHVQHSREGFGSKVKVFLPNQEKGDLAEYETCDDPVESIPYSANPLPSLVDSGTEQMEERAAILEFDGELPRPIAETRAGLSGHKARNTDAA